MKINSGYFFISSLFFLKEKILSISITQQKKISSIVFLIFACLFTGFIVMKRCFFKASKIRNRVLPHMTILQGKVRKGKLQGYAEIFSKDNIKIEGLFKNNSCYGPMKMTYPTGLIIEGTVDDNWNLQGQGRLIYLNGKRIEGEFENGQLMIGEVTIPNEIQQKGEFKNGQLNGYGQKIYANGTVLEGYFKDGHLMVGSITSIKERIKIEGKFESNRLNGQGKMTIGDERIEGEFKNNKLNGLGTVTFSNGRIIKGKFKDWELISEED